VLLILGFAGCATGDAVLVNSARQGLVGLPADDLRLCAGIADREATSPGGTFWTYDRGSPASGFSGGLPWFDVRVSLSGSGECRTTFHLVDGRVRRIGYSAAREAGVMTDSACAPVVRGCMRMLREGSITTRQEPPPSAP
jgi:hypothetical protein